MLIYRMRIMEILCLLGPGYTWITPLRCPRVFSIARRCRNAKCPSRRGVR